MKSVHLNINFPLKFKQVVDLVRQLPYKEKVRLAEVLRKETMHMQGNDQTVTHYASQETLAKDWQLPQEDEAWKDL